MAMIIGPAPSVYLSGRKVSGIPCFLRGLGRTLWSHSLLSKAAWQWRKLSPSAELMVNPGCGARCAIWDTGAPGEGRYHWTVTVFGEPDPVAAGCSGELGEARSRAEGALLAYVEGRDWPSGRGIGDNG